MESRQWIRDAMTAGEGLEPGAELTPTQMAQDILWYIKNYDWVSYPELQKRYGEQSSGNSSHEIPYTNIFLWVRMSEQFAEVLARLVRTRLIHFHRGSILAYMKDGAALKLPVAKRQQHYMEPHWMPVAYRANAWCTEPDCPTSPNTFLRLNPLFRGAICNSQSWPKLEISAIQCNTT